MNDRSFLDEIIEPLKTVDGICAIVLGGSRATGTHTAESDFDIGLFYRGDRPFDHAALGRVASQLDDSRGTDLVTKIGGWGPWVVGGGWLKIRSQAVDFIYRDFDRVASVIDDCCRGKVELCFQPAYTTGFVTSTYMAEIAVCKPLWDPEGKIAELKRRTVLYPAALKQGMIGLYGWQPEFAVHAGRKSAPRADVAFAANCCAWCVASMCHLLFAINETYHLNEKGAVALADRFTIRPEKFRLRVEEVFRLLSADTTAIDAAFDGLAGIVQDVQELVRAATVT